MQAMRRPAPAVMPLLAAALSTACGGGVWVGGTWGDDDAPVVTVAVSAREAPPGTVLRLNAAARDDGWVTGVSFYRIDGERAVLIARDRDPPYEAAVAVPDDGRASLRVFADATDDLGQVGTSAVESVTIR